MSQNQVQNQVPGIHPEQQIKQAFRYCAILEKECLIERSLEERMEKNVEECSSKMKNCAFLSNKLGTSLVSISELVVIVKWSGIGYVSFSKCVCVCGGGGGGSLDL